jgi:hypothetical protein
MDIGDRTLTLKDIQEIKEAVASDFNFAPRISTALALRLFFTNAPSGSARKEMAILEGYSLSKSRTKPATQFYGQALHPLWHKHYFFAGRDMDFNIDRRWLRSKKRLPALLRNHSKNGTRPLEFGNMFNDLVGKAIDDPDHLPSGEWIVFAKVAGQNYYLDVALHKDAASTIGELTLLTQLRASCEWEFPEVFRSFPDKPFSATIGMREP